VKPRPLIALFNMGRESIHNHGASAPNGVARSTCEQARFARGLCQDATAQPSSLFLEQWASMLLGAFWERCRLATRDHRRLTLLESGEPVLESIAGVGNADAKLALFALGRIDREALGARARELAEELSWPTPSRVGEIGTARFTRAFLASSAGDGDVILFRSEGMGLPAHMLVVYIDARLRWIAKHVALLRELDPLRTDELAGDGDSPLNFRPVELEAMRGKAARAIKRTDASDDPPVNESFSNYRAIALARLSPLES
jgi:hypothetical protein